MRLVFGCLGMRCYCRHDLVPEDGIGGPVAKSWYQQKPCSLNGSGSILTVLLRKEGVIGAVYDQRRHADGRQCLSAASGRDDGGKLSGESGGIR